MDQENRLSVFEDTMYQCSRDALLLGAIAGSRAGTWVGQDIGGLVMWLREHSFDQMRMMGMGEDCLDMLERMRRDSPEHRILLVNQGSIMYPGGGVLRGADDPEAQLCRCSTLYPCLSWEVPNIWYQENRNAFCDRGGFIYTPDIVVIRGGRQEIWLPEKDRYLVDVITAGEQTLGNLAEQFPKPGYQYGDTDKM